MKWDRIRKDLENGVQAFQSVGRYLSERARVETSLAKVVYNTQKIRKQIDEKYQELGERIFELRDERHPLENAIVRDLISDLAALKEELDLHVTRVQELGGRTETPAGEDEPEPATPSEEDEKT